MDQRVYPVVHHWQEGNAGRAEWYECPLCGRLTDEEVREHGPEHIIEDASQ